MPIHLLDHTLQFPNVDQSEPYGLLAVGGDLSPQRLILAYKLGIFPWFSQGEPLQWWSPDPRFVLYPDDLKVSKSMRPYFNQKKFRVTFDQCFKDVIEACSTSPRGEQYGTWITTEMIQAYCVLHELGIAHSVEVWRGESLVGGLYGIALGKCFFGESMFSFESNASKFGFISLVRRLKELGYLLIDCQQETEHLGSLGAKSIPRDRFVEILESNASEPTHLGSWKEFMHSPPSGQII